MDARAQTEGGGGTMREAVDDLFTALAPVLPPSEWARRVAAVAELTGVAHGAAVRAWIAERAEFYEQERAQLARLLEMPQVVQRSPEWFALRQGRLTASAVAQALGKGKFGTRRELLAEKSGLKVSNFDPNNPFCKWGTMMEPMTARIYSAMQSGVRLYDFGMVPHPTLSCFGASPDGITEMGRMVEFKSPVKRKIVYGEVPDEYYLQIQGQLAVCGLRECDFFMAKIVESGTLDIYEHLAPCQLGPHHGVVVEWQLKDGSYTYAYSEEGASPAGAATWATAQAAGPPPAAGARFARFTTWRLVEHNLVRVPFDAHAWPALAQDIQAFWNDVEHARASGELPPTKRKSRERDPPPPTSPVKFRFIQDDDDVVA
jgi:putative phage-type endonuclease